MSPFIKRTKTPILVRIPRLRGDEQRKTTRKSRPGVLPRARGDDPDSQVVAGFSEGFPPRTRGRRRILTRPGRRWRFSPAHAGTIVPVCRSLGDLKVFPRTRGDD
ncbi:hypothetical protein F0726_02297 [Acidithiobacillus caldus]|nr:hypothetical protein F0726_02297 [Acidithiobacillus caldus]